MAKKKKRKAKAKKKRQKLKATKSDLKSHIKFSARPSFSDMDAPDGFRPVSITQAMMEFAKQIMEDAKGENLQDEEALQIATILWNYQIMIEDGNEGDSILSELTKEIKSSFGLNDKEASEYIQKMVEKKKHLFPPEIQPRHPMTIFMRKEISHLIPEFSYSKIDLSGESIPPDDEDKKLIKSIIKMDQYIINGADYDDWEDHYFAMKEECSAKFYNWLNDKGLSEFSEDFPYWVEIYLNFIYSYMHDDIVLLEKVSPIYIEEFFADYVLRKIIIEPHEYVQFIPAIKMFYVFLNEKGYIDEPGPIVKLVDAFEPHFIEILRKRFS